MGKSNVYYLTKELNNASWLLKNKKGYFFEEHIYRVILNWCENYYPNKYKIERTTESNDNGKDIILTAECDMNGLFGMDFQKPQQKHLKIYIECKSSDSYKIPYNDLAGNVKLSERDGISYYILVTNMTVTPYTLYQLQDQAKQKFQYCIVDQYLLYRFLYKENEMIGDYCSPEYLPTIHAEYQYFTEQYEGETRFEIILLIRNYTETIQDISIQLKTDRNWEIDTEELTPILEPGGYLCQRLIISKLYYDGLDELCISISSQFFSETIAATGTNISHDFIPSLQGVQHEEIINDIIKKARKSVTLTVTYLFGAAGTGKTRITDEIINKTNGTQIQCFHILLDGKKNLFKKLKIFLNKYGKFSETAEAGSLLSLLEAFSFDKGYKFILFMDDLHNANKEFLDEICLLSEKNIELPIIIVLIGRDDFSEGNKDYFSFMDRCIDGQLSINGYGLEPLKKSETKKLIRSIIIDAPAIVVNTIQKASNNIPLYVIQFIEYMLDISLVKIMNRNTVGIPNPESFSSYRDMPQKIEDIYQKRFKNLQSEENGTELLEFMFMACLTGSEFSKRTFLNYFDNAERLLGFLIARNFLKYTYNGDIKFAHESIYLYLRKYLQKKIKLRKAIAKKIIEYKLLFWDETKDFDKGAIYCWAGDKVKSLEYFKIIIDDIKRIDNYSSIQINADYRPYINEVYRAMCYAGFEEKYLKKALFLRVYLALHFFTPYTAISECEKIEEEIKETTLIKDKNEFRMMLLEQKAHSYINMGQLRSGESILQELLSKIICVPNSMDDTTKFDLYDKLTNLNLKYNNFEIANNYNQLTFSVASKLGDNKLLALAEISRAKMNIYRDIDKAETAIEQANKYLSNDNDPRILCHNDLSKVTISLTKEFRDSDVRHDLLKDTMLLLSYARKGNYANSIIRGYLLLATIEYFDNIDKSLYYVSKGIDAGIKWGQANYMWHFYNLKALIAIQKKEKADYINKLFNTVFHLLHNQNLLYLGNLDFTYENILAIANALKYWQKFRPESFFYPKLSLISYNNSAFSCSYNCDNEACSFNCIPTTEMYKKQYQKIQQGKLPFLSQEFTYPVKWYDEEYYLLFC